MLKLLHRLKANTLHNILGFDLILTGYTLVTADHFFFYPPYPPQILAVLNSDWVGYFGIFIGLCMNFVLMQYNSLLVNLAYSFLYFLSGFKFLFLITLGPDLAST